MSRLIHFDEYLLRVNLRSGTDVRRFCEVHVRGNDVYVFQPRRGETSKVSYHESGQRHVKIGDGPAMFVRHEGRPEWIQDERDLWPKSFENFATLLPYRGQSADEILEFKLPEPSSDDLQFIQVSIGRKFEPKGWTLEDVNLATLQQYVFDVNKFPSEIRVCIRMLVLTSVRSAPAE